MNKSDRELISELLATIAIMQDAQSSTTNALKILSDRVGYLKDRVASLENRIRLSPTEFG